MIVSRHSMRPSDRVQAAQLATARAKRAERQVWIIGFVQNNGVKFLLGNSIDTSIVMLEQTGKFWLRDGDDWNRTTCGQIVIDRLHAAVRAVRNGQASLVAAPKPTPSQAERIAAIAEQRRAIAAAQKEREAAQSRSNAVSHSYGSNYFHGKKGQSVRDDRNWGEC